MWDNGAYSLNTEMGSYGIASNEAFMVTMPIMLLGHLVIWLGISQILHPTSDVYGTFHKVVIFGLLGSHSI